MNAPRRTASQRLAAGPATPTPTEAPTAAPAAPDEPTRYEVQRAIAEGSAPPPAKLSKLQVAMNKVSDSLTSIEKMGADIDELERTAGPKVVFAVATKEGRKQADEARAAARRLRLSVQNMKKDATALLNGLKTEAWAVMDPTIARLDAIESNAKDQIAAEDAKEQQRKDRHEQNIQAIAMMAEGIATLSSADIAKRIDSLANIIVDDSYEEFQAKALTKHREVAEVLAEASFAAAARERAEQERQEREAATTALRAKIAAMKALPSQLEGTDLENVREALRIHKANVPSAEEFGDLIDFAEAVHFKTTKELEELEAMLGLAADHEAEERAAVDQLPVPGPTQAPQPEPDMEPVDVAPSIGTITAAKIAAGPFVTGTPIADPDPFTAPQVHPVHRPAARPVARPVQPVEDPRAALDATQPEVPDLLAAARRVLEAWEPVANGLPAVPALADALRELRAAVDFINEFAD